MDVTNSSSGDALVPCIPHAHPSMTLFCHQNVVGDRAPRHNHCIPHQFFLQGIPWLLLLFDVVGRRQRSPHILPYSSRQKFTNFCFTLDFYSILFRFPEPIPPSCKNAHLPSCSFVYLRSSRRPLHSQRTIPVNRPTTSLVF